MMIVERIWGRHGAIFPRTRWVIKHLFLGVAAVLSVLTPWLIMFLH